MLEFLGEAIALEDIDDAYEHQHIVPPSRATWNSPTSTGRSGLVGDLDGVEGCRELSHSDLCIASSLAKEVDGSRILINQM